MRLTTLQSWKGDPNSNWESSQAAHLPTLTYPPKNKLVHVGEQVSQFASLPRGRFLKSKK